MKGNVDSLPLRAIIGLNGRIPGAVLLHPDNQHLCFAIGSSLAVRNVLAKSLHLLRGHEHCISCIAVSSCGKFIATGESSPQGVLGDIIIWNFETMDLLWKFSVHKGPITSIAFSSDSAFIVSLADDNMLLIWDLVNGGILCGSSVGPHSALCSVFMNSSNFHLVSAGHMHISLWSLDIVAKKLRCTHVNTGTIKRVISTLLVSDDDKTVYCGTSTGDIIEVDVDRALFRRSGPARGLFG